MKDEEISHNDSKPADERWTASGIGALVIAFFGLIVAGWTLVVFHGQFKEMQTQTGILNTQAQQAAKDSIASDQRSRDQLELSERAWVGIKETILNSPSTERDGGILIGLTNTGKTPALKVQVSGIVRREWGESLTNIVGAEKYPVKSVGILMPGADLTIPANFPHLTALGVDYAKHGKIRLVSYGLIHYEDIFKHPRTTTICIYMNKDFQHLEPCSKYNDAN